MWFNFKPRTTKSICLHVLYSLVMPNKLLTTATFLLLALAAQYPASADTINYSDTEAPLVDLVSLSNQKVETSKSGGKLLVDLTASDNLNSIDWVYVSIYRDSQPNPTEVGVLGNRYLSSPISRNVISNRVVSKYQATFDIPKGFAAGTYYVYAFAKDKAGNYPSTCSEQKYCVYTMSRVLPEAIFSITNDGTGNTIDVTPLDLNTKYAELEKQNNLLLSDKTSLQAQINNLSSEKISLTSELSNASKEKISIQLQLASAVRDKEIAQQELASLKAGISALNKNVQSLQKRIAAICKSKPKPKGC